MIRRSVLLALVATAACGYPRPEPFGDDDVDARTDAPDEPAGETIRLTDDIIQNTTFFARNTYVIPERKLLFVKSNATLTIEPGTQIRGESGSALIIARGSRIVADGRADAPIVFTTTQPDNAKTRGFWGGLLIFGAAPINTNLPTSTEATFEAFSSSVPEGRFGGTNPADDSGILRYVRIEFSGWTFVADRQFNVLTLAGVGSGTVVDHVQVHGGADDGIEFFGGTVNVKHILSTQNQDDGFDADNGWSGKAQFVIVQNMTPDATTEASNGMETDNHAISSNYDIQPRTAPTVYNMTVVGNHAYTGGSSFAAVLRRGTAGRYHNMIITGFPNGLEVRDLATKGTLDSGDLYIKSSILYNNDADGDNWPPPQATNDIVESTYFGNAMWSNRFIDPGLSDFRSLTAPSFRPQAGAAALTGGATPPNDGFFDATATYVGAMGTTDWTTGWSAFPQPVAMP